MTKKKKKIDIESPESQHQRDFIELKEKLKYYLDYLDRSGFKPEEISIRKEETNRLLNDVEKIRKNRLNPIKSVETATGTQYKIGDKFHIKGNLKSKYRILAFPNSTYARGICDNPYIGEPYICEAYIENIAKVKEEKLPKLKVGGYFKLKGTGTFFKVTEVIKELNQIVGINKLDYMGAKTNAKVHLSHVEVATKEDYKRQHKKKEDEKPKAKASDDSKKSKKSKKKNKKKGFDFKDKKKKSKKKKK